MMMDFSLSTMIFLQLTVLWIEFRATQSFTTLPCYAPHYHRFQRHSNVQQQQQQQQHHVLWQSSRRNGNRNHDNERIQAMRDEKATVSLIGAILELPADTQLVATYLVGKAQLPTARNETQSCAVLSMRQSHSSLSPTFINKDPIPCLLVPLDSANKLKSLSHTVANQPLSSPVLLGLNTLAVNRDGALFDNLPWSVWTMDPVGRNRDAAGNAIQARYHMGKRDAYNILTGKDWQGQSLAVANLARRLQSNLLAEKDDAALEQQRGFDTSSLPWSSLSSQTNGLAQRILELQIRELEMDLAECDYQLAVCRTTNEEGTDTDQTSLLLSTREAYLMQLETSRARLQEIMATPDASLDSTKWMSSFLDEIVMRTFVNGDQTVAPYRGATGYPPQQETPTKERLPFTSPYGFLQHVIEEQLNGEVIGAVLENASLLEGTVALGGAVILRRKSPTKSVTIAGEILQVKDNDEDFGNKGIVGGETLLVECDADEAIGMSVACNVPLLIESDVWERASLMAMAMETATPSEKSISLANVLPEWMPIDPELSVLTEGQAGNQSTTERVSPLRIPRTTTSLFDSLLEPSAASDQSRPSTSFPTDNPVESLSQYDKLSNDDKARTLMGMSNFEGRLPRPRVLRIRGQPKKTNPLDDLLLPLIDESVRRQYLIRDAELRGDTDLVRELQSEKSRRQVAKEKLEQAREGGAEDVAEWWENEANLYSDLRADVTQNEGSYSLFLDRDDWYERDRQKQAKRVDKKQFGTLLDGIE